ncbi:unnamed protein product [Lathyrus oleraceus]
MATIGVQEIRPPTLSPTSEPPPFFDGTTRLYMSYTCPFVQRVWITRNHKGLQDKIKLIPFDLQNKHVWYKEKVHPENKVPCHKHNGKVISESIDWIKYVDANFEEPPLVPNDPPKKEFEEELIKYVDTFTKDVYGSFKGDPMTQASKRLCFLGCIDKMVVHLTIWRMLLANLMVHSSLVDLIRYLNLHALKSKMKKRKKKKKKHVEKHGKTRKAEFADFADVTTVTDS